MAFAHMAGAPHCTRGRDRTGSYGTFDEKTAPFAQRFSAQVANIDRQKALRAAGFLGQPDIICTPKDGNFGYGFEIGLHARGCCCCGDGENFDDLLDRLLGIWLKVLEKQTPTDGYPKDPTNGDTPALRSFNFVRTQYKNVQTRDDLTPLQRKAGIRSLYDMALRRFMEDVRGSDKDLRFRFGSVEAPRINAAMKASYAHWGLSALASTLITLGPTGLIGNWMTMVLFPFVAYGATYFWDYLNCCKSDNPANARTSTEQLNRLERLLTNQGINSLKTLDTQTKHLYIRNVHLISFYIGQLLNFWAAFIMCQYFEIDWQQTQFFATLGSSIILATATLTHILGDCIKDHQTKPQDITHSP